MTQRRIIAIALLITTVLLMQSFLTLSAASTTFGQTTVGNSSAWQPGNLMVGSKFTASSTSATSISVYITQGGSSNTAKCAIYSDSNKQLVAATEEKTIPAGFNGWMTFNFGSSPTLSAGSSYSLVIWLKGSHSSIRYNYGSSGQSWYAYQPYTGSFPNGPYNYFSGYNQESNVYSIYATINSAGTQLPEIQSQSQSSSSAFGQTSQGGNRAWQPPNVMVGSRFTAPSTDTISSINVYITNGISTANYVKAALYSESNRALVASSQELTINGGASGWFSFPISGSVAAGQRYSLVVWFKNANCYVSYASGSSSQSWYTSASYGSFPSSYNAYGQENNVYSIYATIGSGSTSTSNTYYEPETTVSAAPAITTYQSQSSAGELYMGIGFWMSPGDRNTQRISNARDSSGIPIWVEAGNWGGAHLTSALINYFHSHGVKVVARIWSDGGNVPLDTLLHTYQLGGHSQGSVDYQLSIGPEIDAFMIDECNQWNPDYYRAVSNYIHSKGKQMFTNTGMFNILPSTLSFADKVSTEFTWYEFATNPDCAAAKAGNPYKFIGFSNDWGYSQQPYLAKYASATWERPGYYAPMSLERAVWDVKAGWAGGVSCMSAQPSESGILPDWFEQYITLLK